MGSPTYFEKMLVKEKKREIFSISAEINKDPYYIYLIKCNIS